MPSLLVISDDPDFASSVREALRTRTRTWSARDGGQAARLIREGLAPDVILLDSSPACVPGWIGFVRENVHCTPRCPPLLLIRPETVSGPEGWSRLESMVESLTRGAERESALR
ncbi:MAG: hypothetical protein LC796_02255 [Acidobacteria bacterium]|nr:hypothetical protein [Acidobacteriota bacterium]MCA1610696.1 hypothetical protein [Acidobacteriota bacterium]